MFRTAVDKLLVSLPERAALNFEFFYYHHRFPHLERPVTFNEKIQHRKLYDRNPLLPQLTDKILAKEYVEKLVGPEWIVPTVWHGVELPPQPERNWQLPYVIKASHGCGWNLFIRNESDRKWDRIEQITQEWLKTTFGKTTHEWAYSQIQPRLLVEPYLDEIVRTPDDYKLFVFEGRVAYIQLDKDRFENHRQYFYDRDWKRQNIVFAAKGDTSGAPRPKSMDKMIWAAEKLGADFPFVRVDLYEVDGSPKFGELTFYPNAGRIGFKPRQIDIDLGKLWPMG